MTGHEIRIRFLEHFRSRDHLVLPSFPLVPIGDPTTLFISAGMQPLQPYYKGVSRPPAPRLTNSQKCFRAVDIEEVGGSDRHTTMFEMLGNFAPTGDYFKERAIPWAWELVSGTFGIKTEQLRVTVHPSDEEAVRIWTQEVGFPADRIHRNEENWWGLGVGPCGPDSELFFDRGRDVGCGQEDCYPDHCDRYLEIWNLVFPQFDEQPDGSLVPLPKPAIDTGSGLERMASALQGKKDVFDADLYEPIMALIREGGGERIRTSERIVADHLRGMTFLIGDGVLPSNEGRGYVLRRLIRRALLHRRRLAMRAGLGEGVHAVVEVMRPAYPELAEAEPAIQKAVEAEAKRFERTLEQGMELFESIAARHGGTIPGSEAFRLHDTFGFPIELTRELAAERGLELDLEGFKAEMEGQRDRSRRQVAQRWPDVRSLPRSEFTGYRELETVTQVSALRREGLAVDKASEGDEVEVFLEATPFYGEAGGQVGDTGLITGPHGQVRVEDAQRPAEGWIAHLGRVQVGSIATGEPVTARVDVGRRRRIAQHHSATHLLHKALREELGEGAVQRGSWVGATHSTFDFSSGRATTGEEVEKINRRINEQVRAALPFHESERSFDEAVAAGAMALFEEKYGERVRVVCFGDWTCELCGGTHVESSAQTGPVLITSEGSIGAGLRRIEFRAGEAAEELFYARSRQVGELARMLGTRPDEIAAAVEHVRGGLRQAEREKKQLQEGLMRQQAATVETDGGLPFSHAVVSEDWVDLKARADLDLEKLSGPGVVLVTRGEPPDGLYVLKVDRKLTDRFDATKLKDALGPGGGRAELVSGKLTVSVDEALKRLKEMLR